MQNSPAPAGPEKQPASSGAHERVYTCGTLTYTKMGLAALFAWLLWGDLVFTIMETAAGSSSQSVLPFKLKSLGASNMVMTLIMTVLPAALNMTICPWVSFKSDRHRGRWGRRIPFILWTAPFLTLSLILTGWSEEIAALLHGYIPLLKDVAPATLSVALIGVFYVCFVFFNMFVGSVFWYLFNDVVPPQFLGRFMGLFRLVGAGAGALYSGFIFPYAGTHMRWILTGGALLYFIGFSLVCLRVKEGQYPPPPAADVEKPGFVAGLKAYFKESFTCKFYWYFYLGYAFTAAMFGMDMFQGFFYQEMGLSYPQIGKLSMYVLIAALAATYFTAIFVDRWHPLRVMTYVGIFGATTGFGGWIWLCVSLPGDRFFWLILGWMLVITFGVVLQKACSIPAFMRLMPKSLYGQISGANAVVASLITILTGLLAGVCMDVVKKFYGGTDFAYRWVFVLPWLFGIVATVFRVLGYREWKRLGGDDTYRPPAPWNPSGFEEVADKVKSVPVQPRLVMVSLYTTLAGGIINILAVLFFMTKMRQHGMTEVYWWHAFAFIPMVVVLTSISYCQLVHIRRDMADVAKGKTPRLGVPHHGVLLVNAIQSLMYFPIYWVQIEWMLRMNLQHEMMIFGINTLLLTLGGIVGVQVIRWVERDGSRPEAVPVLQ